ncbi:3-hydroxyacyl-CoA dehydrogenase family protein [Paenibacillus sp. GbtcB18]|uniref:3-hydroxyacyl-CoA dehydrogenase family protein n=1 Tax=Paenibacillus sp. GbtcB18 TaxID=2824763 RepID=UPI001C2F72E2|nr:3-hydroxyacyl-CoA dehydrogenase NAD-binding domain-containing protein [Paenibacillus sp. GbtcB18]
MTIRKVGVIGAGVMGRGIAQNLAQFDFEVVLVDIKESILQATLERIEKEVRISRMFGDRAGGKDESAEILSRITTTTNMEDLHDVDFVIENVTEKWHIKKEIYPVLDQICQPHCVFAVNTSAISITKIAGLTSRPDRILGMHFMNPVPLKKLVETIRGYHTSLETIAIANELLGGIGKESVLVNDMPGFVSNRVLMLTINEAIYLLQDQVATPEDVDKIFKECFGHKMGPLETADLIGLDTILYSIEVLYESFNDSKYRPSPLLQKMVDAGLHGRKNGKGFYQYYTG